VLETKSSSVALTCDLINRQSVTPNDAGCQKLIGDRLAAIGFSLEHMRFGEVDNLWARRGNASPLFVFAGHTDVVPTGLVEQWQTPPFEATIKNGHVYGRGACDMKGNIAAMIDACETFVAEHPKHLGSIAFLITSDEEGVAKDGTVKVVEALEARKEKIDWCLVGEPSCVDTLGDTIKVGRRGSLNGDLTIHGIQGHIAYPHKAANPIHLFSAAMTELCQTEWDKGNEYFQQTSFQISNIHSGTGADNVIPGDMKVIFNFRFSSELTAEQLKTRVEEVLKKHNLKYSIQWRLSGNPFLTRKGKLAAALTKAIKSIQNIEPELSTTGGTSDGRFIATTGCEVAEFGLINATIHKVNECASVADLDKLSEIYKQTMENLLLS
jgi:succinyl-diaminopimelate desuccinylase